MESERSKGCIVPYLPHELIYDILSRVPADSLIGFKTVCKSWHAIIKDPQFIESHLGRSISQRQRRYVLHEYGQVIYHIVAEDGGYMWSANKVLMLDEIEENLYMFGSCNGLVFLSPNYSSTDQVFIRNIISRESILLPATEESDDCVSPGQCMRLGYDHISNQYNVVRMRLTETDVNMEILTVGEPSWRRLYLPSPTCLNDYLPILHLEGSFYWIASNLYGNSFHDETVSFNLHTEKSSNIRCPTSEGTSTNCKSVMDLGGSMGLVVHHGSSTHIWKLIDGNWNCQYTVINMAMPLCMHNNDIFLTTSSDLHKDQLFLHDTRKGQTLEIEVPGGPLRFQACSFVPSLVSPRAIMMEEQREG